MESWFWAESNDPETEEWRKDLSKEEADLVAEWDTRVASGMYNLCQAIQEAAARNVSNEEREEMELEL